MSFGQQPPGGFYGPPGGAPPGCPGGYGGPPAGGPPGGYGGPPAGGPPGGYGGPPTGGPPGGYGGPPGGGFGAPPGGYVPPPGYGSPAPGVPPPMQTGGGSTDPLATVSLVLGIISLPLHFCCYLGWPVGIAAIICGIISVVRIGKEPSRYSGKGLAWGGIISAGLGFLMMIVIFVIYGAALMLSSP